VRYELRIALRYLRARRKDAFISVTTVFTATGVMIGVAALTITLAVMGGFEHSLKERVLALSPQIQVLSEQGSIADWAKIQKAIAGVPGVSGSDPFLVGQAMLSSGRGIGGVVVRGVEPNNPVVRSEWSRYVVAGNLGDLTATSRQFPGASDGVVAIGVTLAHRLKVKVGDRVRMVAPILAGTDSAITTKTGDFAVGAIFDSGMTYLDTNMAFVDLPRAQSFFGRTGRVDGIDVHLTTLGATDRVTQALRRLLLPPYMVRSWVEYNQSASAGFAMLKRVYTIVLMLLIAVAAFNLIATLIMVVMEKRKDIAVLMAMGATRGGVRLIFVLKGLIVGAAGTIAGVIIGVAGCLALSRYQFIHIPREIYGIATVPVSISASNFVWVSLASILLCLLATLYPAQQASRGMPVEVFRT
jgi:lipoprotein-releasing system permease protein